jgi:exopolysaccharide biosynthesis WecB/TagA/CpsF family protein
MERPLAEVDSWGITHANVADAVAAIVTAAMRKEGFSTNTLNLDHLVKLRRDPSFRQAYAAARIVTADGAPVARLARLQNELVERTTGADLVLPLAAAAARGRLPVYLFGSSSTVRTRASKQLSSSFAGGLSVVGYWSPPLGFEPTGTDADACIDRIIASGASICLVALGAPKQEKFAARAVARGVEIGFVSVGAALDFTAGVEVRAPLTLQRFGFEWLWRLVLNRRRFAARYLDCALLLGDLTIIKPLRQKMRFG